jgi:hypothetical protein
MSLFEFVVIVLGASFTGFLVFILASRTASSLYGAPYIGIRTRAIKDLLAFAGANASDHLLDLGAGDGRVVITALKDGLVSTATGHEVARWPYFKGWVKKRLLSLNNLEWYRRNLFEANLSEATLIFLYLYPNLLQQVAHKINSEAKVGARVLCPSFEIDLSKVPRLRLAKAGEVGKIKVYLYEVSRD